VHQAFISYAEEDRNAAMQLCRRLESAGTTCWIAPRDIATGAAWSAAIVDAIESAHVLVLVLSRHSSQSRQVAREVELADRAALPILTLRLDATELDGSLEYFLSHTQWLDATATSLDQAIDSLAARVAELLRQPAGEPPRSTPRRASRGASFLARELSWVVRTWLAVFAKRERALARFDLQNPRTLVRAAAFLLVMEALSAIVSAAASANVSPAYLISYVVSECVEILGAGVILHWTFRRLGGKAAMQSSLAAICFFSAWSPVLTAVLSPARILIAPVMQAAPLTLPLPEIAAVLADKISGYAVLVLLAAFVASTIVVVAVCLGLFRAFREIHRLETLRALAASLLAFALYVLFLVVIALPFARALYS
jgi:hypothetical protein